jgi:beta-glucosidase
MWSRVAIIAAVVCVAIILRFRGYVGVYEPGALRARPRGQTVPPLVGYATAPFQNERPASHDRATLWGEFVNELRPEGMDVSANHADIARFELDVARAKRDVPCLSAFRFGVDWARVVPREGAVDARALAAYAETARVCVAYGLRPVVTLLHFVEPRWFSDLGSFTERANVAHFALFARACGAALAEFRPVFVTLNEPFLYAMLAYGVGRRPPFVRSVPTCLDVICNLMRAHDCACEALRPLGLVTIAKNLMPIYPRSMLSPVELVLAHELHGLLNASYLAWVNTGKLSLRFGPFSRSVRTRHTVDVLGVNHYTAASVRWSGLGVDLDLHGPSGGEGKRCAAGWRLDARALRATLGMIDATVGVSKPVLFTELGAAQVDGDGDARREYMSECLAILAEYASTTRNLLGVLAWTIVDNFEWELGTAARFGHYTIDGEKTDLVDSFARFASEIPRCAVAKAAA